MSTPKTTPETLEAEVARQREELAATVNELQEQVAARARTTGKQLGVLAGAVAVVVIVVFVVKRRKS